jgi:hypothetical protein
MDRLVTSCLYSQFSVDGEGGGGGGNEQREQTAV